MNLMELENLFMYLTILELHNFEYIIDKYKLESKQNEDVVAFYKRKTMEYIATKECK